ncbi:MAG: DUF2326 domain-containing protein [Aliiglaciecola sp.]|uniref:DUF2326 domain-containing protein n=1 Tax=Aliiglaciecola sp. TaxID=1872441 RepID=UPI00329A3BFA
MLKTITCEKLIKSPLTFENGLNSVVGADDAKNSIGKSSILMLIDYAFGGADFPQKCDDVVKHVGHFNVGIKFEFDKPYSFIRQTKNPDYVFDINKNELIDLSKFKNFLKNKYLGESAQISFRDCVSTYFRVYQRNNYNDKRPLDAATKEGWKSIRVRLIKLFNQFDGVSALLESQKQLKKTNDNVSGTHNSGAVRKITKRQFTINQERLLKLKSDLEEIKNTFKGKVTDIQGIINERSRELKANKDKLITKQDELETQLTRIENNLSNQKVRSSKSFKEVVEFFPNVNESRLLQVETFHKGITKILKSKLESEKSLLLHGLLLIKNEIADVDRKLSEIVDSKEDSSYLLERLIELDRDEQSLTKENLYYELGTKTKKEIKDNTTAIDDAVNTSLENIQTAINKEIKKFIEKIYIDKPIAPELNFSATDYVFKPGDDRGTGKGYGNLISLDLAILEKTMLPCLIHDSVLFKHLDVPAVENLIKTYSSFKKQIFISIDEVPKYSKEIQNLIKKSEFLKLSKDNLAFGISWKKINSA